MRLFFLKNILLYIFLGIISCSFSQSSLKLKKGTVVDSLHVPGNLESLYSIYLPKSFNLNKKWPVLFGFNSKGNSKELVKLFSSAAEELGYIIAVADYPEKLKSIKDRVSHISLFTNYVSSLFPIDRRRMYVFGVDDDAFVSSLIPIAFNEFSGVIAINNSYHYTDFIKLRKDFSYQGVINNKNFRYQNFIKIKKDLNQKAIDANLYVYKGDEELPPQSILTSIVISFTLQDMLKGKIETDSIWVKKQFMKEQVAAYELLEEKSFYKAYNELSRIRKRYHWFFDTSKLKVQQKKIRKTGEYKKEKRSKSKYDNQEIFLRELLRLSLEEDVALKQYENLGWWRYKIDELNKMEATQKKYASNMAIRVNRFLNQLVSDYKKSNVLVESEKEIFLNILSTIMNPEDYESYINIISLCAIDQDLQTSLFYLEKMLQNGYIDFDNLYTIQGTLNLKISKEYNVLIKKYLGKSKYYSFIN